MLEPAPKLFRLDVTTMLITVSDPILWPREATDIVWPDLVSIHSIDESPTKIRLLQDKRIVEIKGRKALGTMDLTSTGTKRTEQDMFIYRVTCDSDLRKHRGQTSGRLACLSSAPPCRAARHLSFVAST